MHKEPEETCDVCNPPKPVKKTHKILVTIKLEAIGEDHVKTISDVQAVIENLIEMHVDMSDGDEYQPKIKSYNVFARMNNE